MIGTNRRREVASRDNSENVRSKSRDQSTSNCSQTRNTFDNIDLATPHERLIRSLRRRNYMEPSDSDSGDSDSEEKLSDYETGESSEIPPQLRLTDGNQEHPEQFFRGLLPNRYILSDSSSDDDMDMVTRKLKKYKRPLCPISSSDSSDSGVPIGNRRSVKRMKLSSSSDSSSSGDVSDSRDHYVGNYVRSKVVGGPITIGTEMENSGGPLNSRSDEENEENSSEIIKIRSFRGRLIPVVDSENESDIVSTSSHTVIGRRIPVIESEDDTSSAVTSTSTRVSSIQETTQRINPPIIHGTRRRRTRRRKRRGRTIPVRENVRGSTTNISGSGSTNHNVRRSLVVENDNMSPDSASYNVWEVNIRLEETDDEAISVTNSRRVMGRRIPVVESEDDFNSVSNLDNNEIIVLDGEHEVSNSPELNVINVRRSNVPVISIEQNVRQTLIPQAQAQIEVDSSDSEEDIRPRALSNRTVRTVPSDDSSSSSSTDSDDNDTSTSSSSSIDSDDTIPIRNFRRRNNRSIPTLVDFDYEDNRNNDFYRFDVNIKASTVVKGSTIDEVHNESSSDTDGESEKCPICLTRFKTQEVGKPTSCEHKFCSCCIKEWATKNNTCPVDRKVFKGILVYDHIEGKVIYEMPVVDTPPLFCNDSDIEFLGAISISSDELWYSEFSDHDGPDEICSVCRNRHRSHQMITCDSCNTVFHLDCLYPPLRDFPTSNWYCPYC